MSEATQAAWKAWEEEARRRDPHSSHVPARWISVTTTLGKLAAHGDGDRQDYECVLRAWIKLQPGLKGGSADFLCHLFDQAMAAETDRIDMARSRVRFAVWGMLNHNASREAVWHQACRAAGDALTTPELEGLLSDILDRIYAKRRAGRR